MDTIVSRTDMILAGRLMLENEVRAYRTRLGWSQEELASRSGLSRAGISAIETGRLVPSTAAALALASALECTVEAIFRLPGSRPAMGAKNGPGRRRLRPGGTGVPRFPAGGTAIRSRSR